MAFNFPLLCEKGDLDAIKSSLKTYKINHSIGFKNACEYGHIHVVDFLINLYKNDTMSTYWKYDKIDIIYLPEFIEWACLHARICIVKKLINLYKTNKDYQIINIHAHMYYAFKTTHSRYFKRENKYLFSLGSYITNYTHNHFEHNILL